MRFRVLVALSLLTACESGRLSTAGAGESVIELDVGVPPDEKPTDASPPIADASPLPRPAPDAGPPQPADASASTDAPEDFPQARTPAVMCAP